jgi:hypothetical protein
MKRFSKIFGITSVLGLMSVSAVPGFGAAPADTTISIVISPSSVNVGAVATAKGTAVVTGTGLPVSADPTSMALMRAVDAFGQPTSCALRSDYAGGAFDSVDALGSHTFTLNTSTAGTFGYRVHYNDASHSFSNGFSECADLTVVNNPTASIKACKWYDASTDGTVNGGLTIATAGLTDTTEPVIAGWSMTVDGTNTKVTGADGCVTFDGLLVANSHTISEGSPVAPYQQSGLIVGGVTAPLSTTTSVSLTAGNTLEVDFGNVKKITVGGTKYYDSNLDASILGEAGIPGIKVSIGTCDATFTSCAIAESKFTDASGNWTSSSYAMPGPNTGKNLMACEVLPTTTAPNTFFVQTGPTPNNTSVNNSRCYYGSYAAVTSNLNFGNVCIGPAMTADGSKGFWSNKNGQKLETDADFAALTGLNLVDGSGNPVDFTGTTAANLTALASFLTSANGVNQANQLSAQLAAMTLNVLHGFTTGAAKVYVPAAGSVAGCGGLGAGPFYTVSQLTTAANSMLGTNPVTLAGNPARACEAALQTQLDSMNNNKLFVEPNASACTFTTPY